MVTQPEMDLEWVSFRLLFRGLIRVHSVETVLTSAVSVNVCVCVCVSPVIHFVTLPLRLATAS